MTSREPIDWIDRLMVGWILVLPVAATLSAVIFWYMFL